MQYKKGRVFRRFIFNFEPTSFKCRVQFFIRPNVEGIEEEGFQVTCCTILVVSIS